MLSFNEWLSKKDAACNELFEPQSNPYSDPYNIRGRFEEILTFHATNYSQYEKAFDVVLSEKAAEIFQNIARSKPGEDPLGTERKGQFIGIIDQIGKSLVRFLVTSKPDEVILGHLENQMRSFGSQWAARGENAWLMALNRIAKKNGYILQGNVGGTGNRLVRGQAALVAANQGKFSYHPQDLSGKEQGSKTQRIQQHMAGIKSAEEKRKADAQAAIAAKASSMDALNQAINRRPKYS